MTPDQFQQWADRNKLTSNVKIAAAIGIHRNTAQRCRTNGTDSLTIRLAMSAYSMGLRPWPYEQKETSE